MALHEASWRSPTHDEASPGLVIMSLLKGLLSHLWVVLVALLQDCPHRHHAFLFLPEATGQKTCDYITAAEPGSLSSEHSDSRVAGPL